MSAVRLFFPEWQGYALHVGGAHGARMLREQVCGDLDFTDVEVSSETELPMEAGIVGREAVVRNTRACLETLRRREPREIFTLGGTCGIELGPVSYLNELHRGDMAVVWLDAHGDLNTPATSPSGHFHGMALRTLLGEGDPELVSLCLSSLTPEGVFLVGVRDLDPAEKDYVTAAGLKVLDVATTGDDLVGEIEDSGFAHVYVHLDLDVLEPRDFDEVIYPVPEGMRLERLLDVLRGLGERLTVVGSSLLEFVPGPTPRLDELARIVDALHTVKDTVAGTGDCVLGQGSRPQAGSVPREAWLPARGSRC